MVNPLLDAAGVALYACESRGPLDNLSFFTQHAGPGFRTLLGYPADTPEAEVRFLDEAHIPDGSARRELFESLVSQETIRDFLIQARRCDGEGLWLEISAVIDRTSSGALRVNMLVRNVTERRGREARAREVYQELAKMEQTTAVARRLADAAHELRNPLATILAWAERLDEPAFDPAVRRAASQIVAASDRASRIVRNLLTLPATRQSTRELVDVNQVVRETVALRRDDTRIAGISVDVHLSADVPAVLADAHQLQQVLLNLVINAEQAMQAAHGRGTLTIRTRRDGTDPLAVVEVCDDGPGVPEAVRPRIFEPFFTTKAPGRGTGLGLAMAQSLVHEHGGRLRLDERSGGGATFIVELPGREPKPAATRQR